MLLEYWEKVCGCLSHQLSNSDLDVIVSNGASIRNVFTGIITYTNTQMKRTFTALPGDIISVAVVVVIFKKLLL